MGKRLRPTVLVPACALAVLAVALLTHVLRNDAAAAKNPVVRRWPQNPYPVGSVWNPKAPLPAGVAVDPASSRYVSFWVSHLTTPMFVIGPWSVPVVTVTRGAPTYRVNIVPNGHAASNINRFGPVPIPRGTKPDPSSDGHLAILDYTRGVEWDMWQARYDSSTNTWTATCGVAFRFTQRASPHNICSANTAGFPAAAGLVTPEEIEIGRAHV